MARRCEALQADLKKVDDELEHAILAAMRKREARRAHLRAELAKFERRAKVGSLDAARLGLNLRDRLTDCYYESSGQGSISELVCGVVLPKAWWPQRDSFELP